jgi:hypothetical protein
MDHLRRLTIRLTAVALFGMLPQAGSAADDKPLTWGGLGFGVGIATDFMLSGGTRLAGDNAVSVVPVQPGGIVRVNEARNVGVGLVLEAHYFLRDYLLSYGPVNTCPKPIGHRFYYGVVEAPTCTELAHGPFVAVEVGGATGTDAVKGPVTAYALGWMVGMRHRDSLSSASPNTSWNFGVGFRIEPGARFLGEGIVPNQPLPLGESLSPVRTRSGTAYGVMLLSSFGFTGP